MDKRLLGLVVLILSGLLIAPIIIYPVFLMKVLCFALFACAFNLLLGYTGNLSFGHAAYFGSAGYITGHCVKVLGVTPEVGILIGTGFATILGFLFGSLAIRRKGIYFSMITLALAQMIYFMAVQMKFTGGEDGLQGVSRGRLLGIISLENNLVMYYFVLAIFLFGFLLIYRIIHSPYGEVLKSIRENESRAISLGYDVDKYKLLAFVLSAGLAGLAGSIKTMAFQLASLTDVHWQMSGDVVLMTLLGGMGTIIGPIVGATMIVSLQNYLASLGSWVTVIMGSIFVICVMAFRRGIVGELTPLLKKIFPFPKPHPIQPNLEEFRKDDSGNAAIQEDTRH